MKQLPNIVTILRILCSPLILVLLIMAAYERGFSSPLLVWSFWIYVIAATTDWVDGALARALDAKSELGAKLDLWADKLLVGLSLLAIIITQIIYKPHTWLTTSLLGALLLGATSLRDFIITDIRAKGAKIGCNMPATFLAKSKTAVIMAGIGIYLGGQGFGWQNVQTLGTAIIWIGAIMSLYTGYQYYMAYRQALINQESVGQ